MDIVKLLRYALKKDASDLHLAQGELPAIRIYGDIHKLNAEKMAKDDMLNVMKVIMTEEQRQSFKHEKDLDFSLDISNLARFRVNVFEQNNGLGMVFRIIANSIKTIKELGLPDIFKKICLNDKGLVLITGQTGSGKSTTLAAMIDFINKDYNKHIITIEDPIEFIHKGKRSIVNQREVFRNTHSFNNALRASLREDPDIIMVGEMRDLETVRLAITAAETGHLVLGTMHTGSTSKTIDRIIDVFPGDEKNMVRSMLSESVKAIVSQHLIKRKDGNGRIAAHEILISNNAIKTKIRDSQIHQIISTIETSQKEGMMTLDMCLEHFVNQGIITRKEAHSKATNKDRFSIKGKEMANN